MSDLERLKAWRPQITGWSDDILPWYEKIAVDLPDRAVCVEVGIYHGRSLVFLAECLAKRGKNFRVFGVDPIAWESDGWDILQRNIRSSEGAPLVALIRKTSAEAVIEFADKSCDLVFVDAVHDGPNVREDLGLWMPKIKPGGIISGHDYEPRQPGLMQVVDEILPGRTIEGSVFWKRT